MWKIFKYEARGRSHIKEDIPCQDKTIYMHDGDFYFAALADGAGSAKYSHYGAKLAIEALSDYMFSCFDFVYEKNDLEKIKSNLIHFIKYKLSEKSNELNCNVKDMASTLLAIAIKKDKVIVIHLGDGAIMLKKKGKVTVLSEPFNGEFANNTIFTTSTNSHKFIRMYKGKTDEIEGFVLMSDGTSNSLYNNKRRKISPLVERIINWSVLLPYKKMQQIIENLINKEIINRTFDDCSLVIISKEIKQKEVYNNLSFYEKMKFFNSISKNIVTYENIIKLLNKKPMNMYELYNNIYKCKLKNNRCSNKKMIKNNNIINRSNIKKLVRIKSLKLYLNKLKDLGLIRKKGNKYFAIMQL